MDRERKKRPRILVMSTKRDQQQDEVKSTSSPLQKFKAQTDVPSDSFFIRRLALKRRSQPILYKIVRTCTRCSKTSKLGKLFKQHHNIESFLCSDCFSELMNSITPEIKKKIRGVKGKSKPYIPTSEHTLEQSEPKRIQEISYSNIKYLVRRHSGTRQMSEFECHNCKNNHSWGRRYYFRNEFVDVCESCYNNILCSQFVKIIYTPMGNRR